MRTRHAWRSSKAQRGRRSDLSAVTPRGGGEEPGAPSAATDVGGSHGEGAEALAFPALQAFDVSSTKTRGDLVRCVSRTPVGRRVGRL